MPRRRGSPSSRRRLQTCRARPTIDAVAGGTSASRASGSARSVTAPSAPWIASLYRSPTRASGTNTSQTPGRAHRAERVAALVPAVEVARRRRRPRADGAQTANATPATPSTVSGRAPSASHSRRCVPSPIRCRSSSPIVGGEAVRVAGAGASTPPRVDLEPVARHGRAPQPQPRTGPPRRSRASPPRRPPRRPASPTPRPAARHGSPATRRPGAGRASPCGSWCAPRASRADSPSRSHPERIAED